MSIIRYIHWNAEEAREMAIRIQKLGHRVQFEVPSGGQFIKNIEAGNPDVIIINLSRLPSQGRDFAFLLRSRKTTRHIPILFLDGQPDKVKAVRDRLPDAIYTTWDRLEIDIHRVLIEHVSNLIVPKSMMDAYKGKPLVHKLGIKPNFRVVLLNSPENFKELLEPMPPDVVFETEMTIECDVLIWFVKEKGELCKQIKKLSVDAKCPKIWIAWPKQKSSLQSNLTQNIVRENGLAAGLVDYKISSFDDTWSGLLFAKRDR